MTSATVVNPTGTPAIVEATPATGRATLRRVLKQRSAIVGIVILAGLCLVALFAGVIAPYDSETSLIGVEDPSTAKARAAPCVHLLGCAIDKPEHLMGLDGNVRDEFSRVVFGSRISLLIGFVTVGIAIVIGMVIGAVAGYAGGRVDNILMRIMDMVLAFPALLLAIVIVTILGRGLVFAMIAVSVVAIPVYARVMRSSVISIREQDYVTAARALGESSLGILMRRVIPNSLTPMIVQGTLGIGTAVLEVAALSFLGLGAQDPQPEWGRMIGVDHNNLQNAPHLIFFPGVALTLVVLGFNLLGDGLRDAFDPRLSR